jgi:hypothetical protein
MDNEDAVLLAKLREIKDIVNAALKLTSENIIQEGCCLEQPS